MTTTQTKFRTVVLHISEGGGFKDYIYELDPPLSFRSAQNMLDKTAGDAYMIKTAEGLACFKIPLIVGFELGDPV